MPKNSLDPDELEILDSYEQGEWHPIAAKEKRFRSYQAYAAATLGREGYVNISLPLKAFERIRRKAHEDGIPYEVLIADIVRKFAEGRLVEQ